jgi:hypothetical protein
MDKKKIIKIASIIQNTLKTSNERIVNYYSERLTSLNNKINELHKQMNRCTENDFEGARKNIVSQINTCIIKAEDFLKAAKSNINKEIYVPSIEDLISEITAIKNSFSSLEYRDGKLIITSDTVILQDTNFGKFKIKIDLEWLKEKPDKFLTIDAISPNFSSEGEYVHPHIDDHTLCCGEGYDILMDAARQGRIEDLFKLVLATINTYNEGSAYCKLDDWEGKSCSFCGDRYDYDDGFHCTKCDRNLCDCCTIHCQSCEEYFCEDHISKSCDSCNGYFCCYCTENNMDSCNKCGSSICENCKITRCSKCEEHFCDECISECEVCSSNVCRKCLDFCEECEKGICSECALECDNCSKKYCEDCYDEESCNLNKVKV